MTEPITAALEHGGALLCLRLAAPKANILDAAMMGALQGELEGHRQEERLKAVLLSHEGPSFSYGASVQEHLPGQVAGMLKIMHGLVLALVEYPVPVLVAVAGQCLGGGFEVAAAGSLIFAAPDARFGQPEIKLGIIAPAASCLLPERLAGPHAEDILYSGRSISAEEAFRMGLVREIADNPEQAALAYFSEHLQGLSSSALRHAVTAARRGLGQRLREKLAAVETQYLDEIMATEDALEGLNAFIEKRAPKWQHD